MASVRDRQLFLETMRGHRRYARLRVIAAGAPLWLGGTLAALVAAVALAATPLGDWRIGKLLCLALAPVISAALFRVAIAVPLARVGALASLCGLLESRGSFRNLLIAAEEALRVPERWPGGTADADELLRMLFAEAAARARSRDRGRLLPFVDLPGNLAALACSAALLIWAAVAAPPLLDSGLSRLAHPLRAEGRAPVVGIYLAGGDRTVEAGSTVSLSALDFGSPRREAVCEVRFGSGLWRPAAGIEIEQDAIAFRYTARIAEVSESFHYRFRRDGMASAAASVTVLHPPLVSGLAGSYYPPAYTGLSARDLVRLPARLEVPTGSRVIWSGKSDHDLAAAWAVTTAGDSLHVGVSGDSLFGELKADEPVEFRIEVHDLMGMTGGGGLAYLVEPIPDRDPLAALAAGRDDGLLPMDARLALRATAEDDYGLSGVSLQLSREDPSAAAAENLKPNWIDIPLWRHGDPQSAPGEAAETREIQTRLGPARIMAVPDSEIRTQADLMVMLDAGDLDLVPGDILLLRLLARDNRRPGPPGTGVSRVLRLAMPSAVDMVVSRAENDEDYLADMDDLRNRSVRMGEDLERIARELMKNPRPDFDRRQELETALARQQELQDELADMAQNLQSELDELAATNQTSIPLLEKMEEVADLLEAVQSDELDRMRERLRREAEELSPTEIGEAVAEAARNQKELLERLDRAISLLREMAREQDLEGMTGAVERMLREQQDLMDSQGREQSAAEDSRRQEALADEATRLEDRLREALDELGEESRGGHESPSDEPLREALAEALRRLEEQDPAEMMREASRRMSAADPDAGQSEQHEAMQSLAGLYSVLLQGQQAMQAAMQQHVSETLRRVAFDVLSLSARQEEIVSRIPNNLRNVRAPELARSEARLLRAMNELGDRLREVMTRSPMVVGSLLSRLRAASGQIDVTRDNLIAGWGAEARGSGRRGLGAMNTLVINLLTNAESSSGDMGGSGGAPSFSEELRRMAKEQAGLNGLAEMMRRARSGGQGLSQEQRSRMDRLSGDQQQLADQTRELAERRRDDPEQARRLLGSLDDIAAQMEQVVRDLGSGALDDETLRRQEKILGRLLDAHNSVRQRDFSTRRESRSAGGVLAPQSGETAAPGDGPSPLLTRQRRIEKVPLEYRDLVRRYYRTLDGIAGSPEPEDLN